MKRIFWAFLLTFGFILSVSSAQTELLLRDNLKLAKAGDYLITAQNKSYTALLIRQKNGDNLAIEEITLPSSRLPSTPSFSWRQWIESGAQGNTCWLLYHIHLPSGNIQQTFSFSRNEWVTMPQSQNFLTTLLNLHFKPIPENERKKVGPPPSSDSADRRDLWHPPLIVDGKKVQGIKFEGWRTRWPEDGGDLSGKLIEVYLPKESQKYPAYFPYWLQVNGVIGKAKVRIVDSGSGIVSPAKIPS